MKCINLKSLIFTLIISVMVILLHRGGIAKIVSKNSKIIYDLIPGEQVPVNVTLVMAYFNLGDIVKTLGKHTRKKSNYLQWVSVYQWVRNSMVIFSDDEEFLREIKRLRQNLNDRTEYIHLAPNEPRWALSLLDDITNIFSDPNYPKISPETVVPKYSCAMHAKYELVMQTVKRNPFFTPYFAWCDVGLLRLVETKGIYYYVSLPPYFDDTRIAFSKVEDLNEWTPPQDVIGKAMVWVAGGFFLGHGNVLIEFFEQYRRFTEMLIQNKIMGSDEQVMYMMFLHDNKPNTTVGLQLYDAKGTCDQWFHLALISIRYMCKVNTITSIGGKV